MDVDAIADFIRAIQGHRFENVYLVSLYTGMREGEVLGLTWDVIDFQAGTIVIKQQLQKARDGTGRYQLISPKNGKSRRITPAPSVMAVLNNEQTRQAANKAQAGSSWDNPLNLVFTNEEGHNLSAQTVYLHFKKIAAAIGHPDTRLHDLRHTYAVISIQNGDDIKTVQENLGHHTAAFTLDTYAHVTNQMQQASAAHMEAFIQSISST
ncbi:MAG: site-specific integrase [Oscillospiraceae bacterium]|nr:site-specific integrase [Oscillospiraceae bacterium]